MNNFRKYSVIFVLFVFLTNMLCPAASAVRIKNRDIDKQEEKIISQIEFYYNQGKENLAKGKFLTAIVKFNNVIKLEKDFYIAYTPYAKEYIQRAQERIKEKETRSLSLDIGKKPEERRAAAKSEAGPLNKSYEYTIGEADVLYVHIWQEETLSREVIVRPDGRISFPLAGDITTAGLTFPQLKEELTKRLKGYIKYPVVSISLKKLGGEKVIVLGEVSAPGVYSVTGKKTVLEAVALAGGITPHAVPSSTILIRGGFSNPKGKRINLARAINKADMSQNVVLQPEDVIYIPKKFIANVNYTLTQILGPISQGLGIAQTFHKW
ncbi:MAG: polysaccharide biosynthesis/export family protein [Candidatus Omnitrophota bacterium]|nr:polysaccharide biosynthesis/export family protein [Candidatus Omnitrophota bacterium]